MRPSRSGSDPLEVCAEFCPPASPKGIERKRADASDLGRDRGLLGHRLAHGYALAGAEFPGSQAGPLPAVTR